MTAEISLGCGEAWANRAKPLRLSLLECSEIRTPQSGLRYPRSPARFGGVASDARRWIASPRQRFLRLTSKPAYGDGLLLGLALADDEHRRNLGEAVLADLVVDLLVPKIGFGPKPGRSKAASTSPA